MLDNAATVWLREFSDGNAMNLNNMPILQVGSCGKYLRVGHAVNLHDGLPTLHPGNGSSACEDGTATPIGTDGSHPSGTRRTSRT